MANEITTQQVVSGAATNQDLALGGADKIKAPSGRDNTFKQAVSGINKKADQNTAKKQLPEDPEKVKEIVKDTVDFFNEFVKEMQVDLRYEVDDKTDEVIIKFFEKGTDKLIRQIPTKEILHLKQRINDLLGIIYDETA